MPVPGDPRIAVVVPVFDGCDTLPRCLHALARSVPPPAEVIVVDDGSADGSGELARDLGCTVVRIADGPCGPAHARNAGVAASHAELVLFVDSDVEVRPDALDLLAASLRADERTVAAFGSYDDDPAEQDVVSLYANLRHHAVHQGSPERAETFWAGLGCVRRAAFDAVGGFDAGFAAPSIEDIELGMRLRAAGGEIRVVHGAQGRHLKRWTLRRLWRTDVFARAVAWSRLLVRSPATGRSLNVSPRERAAAVLSLAVVAGPLIALASLRAWPALLGLAALAAWAALNARFFALLLRRGGLRGAAAGGALHLAYYLYSTVAFGAVALASAVRPARRAGRR